MNSSSSDASDSELIHTSRQERIYRGGSATPGEGKCVAKRFTDSDKWKRPWFHSLNDKQKLAWIYLLDDCDHRGVWLGNFSRMSFDIGVKIDEPTLASWFPDKIFKFEPDKFFIPSFVEFQYPKLSNGSTVHRAVIEFLTTYLDNPTIKGFAKALLRIKDKDKDKDKAMDKDKKKKTKRRKSRAVFGQAGGSNP